MTAVPGAPVPPATAPEPGDWPPSTHIATCPPGCTERHALTAPDVVAGLLADVAEARDQLADVQRGAGEWIRETVARETAGLTAQLAAVTGERDRYAGELDEARAERDRYRKWLEAIAECRAGMPYPDAARQALGGDHA